jgi:hypothetical protein
MTLAIFSGPALTFWIVLAAAAVLATGYVGSVLAGRRRDAGYGLPFADDENNARAKATADLRVKDLNELTVPDWFSAGEKIVSTQQAIATLRSRTYHTRVSRAFSVLTVASITTVCSALVWRDSGELKYFATAFDLIAVVYAFGNYIWARFALRGWVKERAITELIRSALHLNIVFNVTGRDKSLAVAFLTSLVSALGNQIKPSILISLASRTADTDRVTHQIIACRERLISDSENKGVRPDVSHSDVLLYIRERPIAQIAYLSASQNRLLRREWFRRLSLWLLFVCSLVFALLKAMLVFGNYSDIDSTSKTKLFMGFSSVDILTALFLFVVILSAAGTAAVINRNERSLKHNYRAQQQRITDWARRAGPSVLAMAQPSSSSMDARDAVVQLERIITDDVVEFANITIDDGVEIPV